METGMASLSRQSEKGDVAALEFTLPEF